MLNPSFQFSALILGAGLSRRFGPTNKLLQDYDGKPVIRHVLDELKKLKLNQIIIVLGHQADEVRQTLKGDPFTLIENQNYQDGMGTSIAAGAQALDQKSDGVFICPGDMPLIKAEQFTKLAEGFAPDQICVPVHEGQRGHPVLFANSYFPELELCQGDQGARTVLQTNKSNIHFIETPTPAIHYDIDEQDDIKGSGKTSHGS